MRSRCVPTGPGCGAPSTSSWARSTECLEAQTEPLAADRNFLAWSAPAPQGGVSLILEGFFDPEQRPDTSSPHVLCTDGCVLMVGWFDWRIGADGRWDAVGLIVKRWIDLGRLCPGLTDSDFP